MREAGHFKSWPETKGEGSVLSQGRTKTLLREVSSPKLGPALEMLCTCAFLLRQLYLDLPHCGRQMCTGGSSICKTK